MNQLTTTKVFTELWNRAADYKIHLLRGGARSSKSYSLMQMVFLWLMTGRIGSIEQRSGIFAIVRNVLPALKATVLRDFENYLTIMGVADYVDYRKTKNEFEYNNRVVSFFPATDESRLKGRQHTFVWINEANDLTWYEYQQLGMRTSHQIWLDYNPDNPDSFVKTELEDTRDKDKDINLMVSTIKLNPFLSDSQRKWIQDLEKKDKDLYEVYTLGRWVKFKGLIFPSWEIIKTEDFPKNTIKQCYSMDIGFNDATVLLHMALIGEDLFVDEIFHKTELTTGDVIKLLRDGPIRNDRIIADSQAKSAIKEIKDAKFRIQPCKKTGPDFVLNSIKRVKAKNLFITDRSLETMRELKRFKWKKDNNGKDTDEPLNLYKNAPDAIRYGNEFLTKTNTIRIL